MFIQWRITSRVLDLVNLEYIVVLQRHRPKTNQIPFRLMKFGFFVLWTLCDKYIKIIMLWQYFFGKYYFVALEILAGSKKQGKKR